MKIAAVQHEIVWHDPASTQERLVPLIGQAAGAGARLVVLAEMYATGFSMSAETISEAPGGPNERFLVERAGEHGVWTLASVAQRGPSGRPRNTAILAAPDGTVHRYAKRHPFTHSGEHEHYEAGAETLTVDVEGLRVSVFICYDLRFADQFWNLAHDTDCYVVVANWPAARREHWRTLLRARAIENQAYVVGVNRVGADRANTYAGDSRIIDPAGSVLVEASHVESVLVSEVDPAVVREVRGHFPVLNDRVRHTQARQGALPSSTSETADHLSSSG